MRKKTLIFILLVTLGTVSLFGVLGFGMMPHSSSHYCPVSAVSAEHCVSAANAIAFVEHHVSGMRAAFRAVFEESVLAGPALFALLAILLSALWILLQKRFRCEISGAAAEKFFYKRQSFASVFSSQLLLRRWFARSAGREPFLHYLRALFPVFV
ncbi:MAG: hypothetical protein HYU35_01970 [Parcubacteria group bacterium]|nr:hypothetical protein [Parcubacteria group bacterium]